MRRLLAVLAVAAASCASGGLLREATARETGHPVDEVKVSEQVKVLGEVRWKARHGDQTYRCESICASKKCDELDEGATVCDETTFEEVE